MHTRTHARARIQMRVCEAKSKSSRGIGSSLGVAVLFLLHCVPGKEATPITLCARERSRVGTAAASRRVCWALRLWLEPQREPKAGPHLALSWAPPPGPCLPRPAPGHCASPCYLCHSRSGSAQAVLPWPEPCPHSQASNITTAGPPPHPLTRAGGNSDSRCSRCQ